MKKVTTVELVNKNTNESLGHAPVIEEKGKKSKMFTDGDKPLTFDTKKQARDYGVDYIKFKD